MRAARHRPFLGHDGAVLHRDRDRAGSFGDDAQQYDRARPSYPPALIDDLLVAGPCSVLDVGCGTGIAARLFADRGCEVLGVEPDERMAAVARGHGLSVEAGTFETWEADDRRFDLVSAAQCWHWIDPDGGAAKAAQVLRPGGRLALFWNVIQLDPELRGAFSGVYQDVAPELDDTSVALGNVDDQRLANAARGIRRTGDFDDPATQTYRWDRPYTATQWIDHLHTHSDHRLLPRPQQDALLGRIRSVVDAMGAAVTVNFQTSVLLARRTTNHPGG
jgi:SAM-dependent methyltransferase